MRIWFLIFLSLFSSLTLWGQTSGSSSLFASSRIQGFTITSESLDRDLENDTLKLSGNVKIIYQNQYFEGDTAFIDFKKKQAVFTGKVKIQSPSYTIGGEKITLDYEANQGIIYVGYVQSNNIRFQGDVIEKMSDTEFYVSNADYTTCSNCPATWSFEGSRIRAELGGYAYIKSSFLKVNSVPVFWLPYLVVPLKSERQSGLLAPEFGFVNGRQLFLSQDFFWAISRSQDATFTLKNYEIGGLKPMAEYRYVIGEDSYGQVKASHIRDSLFAGSARYNAFQPLGEKDRLYNRWSIKSYDQYVWDKSDKLQMNLNFVSDLQYPKDFSEEFKNYSDSALENRATYSHFFEHSLISIDSSYYTNLLQANPLAHNSSSVHRLPEIRFDSTYQKFDDTPFYYKVESSWTNFYRGKAYDDMSLSSNGQKYVSNTKNDPGCEKKLDPDCHLLEDNNFDPNNDMIRTGKRFMFKGALTTETYGVSDYLNLTPTLSYNEAHYLFDTDQNRSTERRFVQLDLNTRTKFYAIYDQNQTTTGFRYKNEIIPELQYAWIPWLEDGRHPFFGNTDDPDENYSPPTIVADNSLNTPGGVLFDSEDRVYDRHIIRFSMLDRLVRKKVKDNVYKTLMSFRLTQSYDLYQSQHGAKKDQPLSDLSGTLTVDLDQIQSYTQVNYFPYLSATNTTTSLSYLNEHQQYFKIGWASKRTEDPKQDDFSFAIGFVSYYVNVLTGFVFDASEGRDSSSRLKKLSLITQLKPPGECWAVNFYRDQKVGSQPEWRVRFDFSFDGKPTKVIPPAELNIN